MNKTSISLLLACALSLPLVARAQDEAATLARIFTQAPRVEHLPNGLTVITLAWDSPGIVAYFTLVRVGSRDEVEAGHTGFAHLFEHMMFRGTERHPQDQYEELIQSFGADNNAYTTSDFTLYTVNSPAASLDRIVELEADRFQHLQYDEPAFRTETGAVRGEYDTSVSSPFQKMWESLSEISFSRHTYGHTTLGYLRDIDAMPTRYEYSRRFFQRFYTPDDATVIVAGDVDHDRVMALVRQHYGAWRGRRDRPRIPVEPEPAQGGRRDLDWPSATAPRALLGYRAPAFVAGRTPAELQASLRETAALQVVHGLAFSEPSALYQRLVVDERRLLELGSWAGEFSRDPGLFVVTATLADGQGFDAVLDAIQGELDSIGSGGASPERIEEVKSHVRYAMLSALQTPSDAAELIAQFVAMGGELEWLARYLAALAALGPDDVARAAHRYLVSSRRFVITLSHPAEQAR